MKTNKHTITIHARCPYQPVWDYYEATFTSRRFIQCEELEAAAEDVRGANTTQEGIASRLREILPSHVSIKVVGRHGANCLTEITR